MSHLFLPMLSPLILLAVAYHASRRPGLRPGNVSNLTEWAVLAAFAVSAVSAALFVVQGEGTSGLIGLWGVGFSVRLDAVSATMLVLVSFIGWIVLRYSATCMDGEPRHGAFTGWMSVTLAAVLLLVMPGYLAQPLAAGGCDQPRPATTVVVLP